MTQLPATREKADEAFARWKAVDLMASFMQRPPDEKTMLKLVTRLCVGQPKSLLERMIDPRTGPAGESNFFSLSIVKEWLDRNSPQPAWKPFAPLPPEPEMTPEEKARCDAMWATVKPVLEATAKAMRVDVRHDGVQRIDHTTTQAHNPEALKRGLEFLENMRVCAGVEVDKAVDTTKEI